MTRRRGWLDLIRRRETLVPLLLVLGLSGALLWKGLRSPERVCSGMIEEAAALEERGARDEAIAGYEEVIATCADSVDLSTIEPASIALARLYAQPRPAPVTPADSLRAREIAARYLELPARVRTARAGATLGGELLAWADGLRGDDPEVARAQLRLLEVAHAVGDAATQDEVARRERALRVELGTQHAADWPLFALDILVAAGGAEGLAGAAELARRRAEHPALLRAAGPLLAAWVDGVRGRGFPRGAARGDLGGARRGARRRRRRGQERGARGRRRGRAAPAPGRRAPRSGGRRGAGPAPARSRRRRRRPRADRGARRARLDDPDAQLLRAALLADEGRLDEADRLLADVVELSLPALDRARRDYERTAGAIDERLWAQAESGGLPPEIEEAVDKAEEADKQGIVQEWVDQQVRADPLATRRWQEYQLHAHAITAATELGALRLRRSLAAEEPARGELLRQAERAFLLVRESAEGSIDYHLGLGQVRYRLGQVEAGEAELGALLERDDPETTLLVADAYRELGMDSRAAELFEEVVASGAQPHAQEAAKERAILSADLDEKEAWLRKASADDPIAALRPAAEAAEAARVLEAARPPLPKLVTWVIGVLAGSEALERRGAGSFQREPTVAARRLDCLLDPDRRDARALCALIAERAPASPRAHPTAASRPER